MDWKNLLSEHESFSHFAPRNKKENIWFLQSLSFCSLNHIMQDDDDCWKETKSFQVEDSWTNIWDCMEIHWILTFSISFHTEILHTFQIAPMFVNV